MGNKMEGLIKKLQEAFDEGFSWARKNGYVRIENNSEHPKNPTNKQEGFSDSKLYSEESFQRHKKDRWYEDWARSFGEGTYLFFHPLVKIYRLFKK